MGDELTRRMGRNNRRGRTVEDQGKLSTIKLSARPTKVNLCRLCGTPDLTPELLEYETFRDRTVTRQGGGKYCS